MDILSLLAAQGIDVPQDKQEGLKTAFSEEIYWSDSRGQTIAKNGIQISDSVLVYFYDDDYLPKAGDIIVKGNVDFEFDSSSQKSSADSMKL